MGRDTPALGLVGLARGPDARPAPPQAHAQLEQGGQPPAAQGDDKNVVERVTDVLTGRS